jgi:hypothetical protein
MASLAIVPALFVGPYGSVEPQPEPVPTSTTTTRPEPTTSTTTSTTTTSTTTTTTTEAPAPPTTAAEVLDRTVYEPYAARVHGRIVDVYDGHDSPAPRRSLTDAEATSVPGAIPMTFLVRTPPGDRVEVYLPVRPNGSVGWVDRADVEIVPLDHRVEVTLSEFRIRVYEHGSLILDEPIGVGRAERPTPGGVYHIKELLQPPDPGGPYGTYAYGLSGFSNVLTSFNGGQGVIGIHGTNDPSSVGREASSGCIRLRNDVIERMVEEIGLPLGTPVLIRA